MFVALAGAELSLGTGTTTAPSPPVPSDDLFLSPTFVQTLAAELAVDEVFGPIVRGAAAALGKLVDRLGAPIVGPAHTPKGGTFLVRCGLLYRRGQGETDRLCIPAGAGLQAQVLSLVVRYGRASALWSAVVVPSLLDAALHGPAGRWVLLLRVQSSSLVWLLFSRTTVMGLPTCCPPVGRAGCERLRQCHGG